MNAIDPETNERITLYNAYRYEIRDCAEIHCSTSRKHDILDAGALFDGAKSLHSTCRHHGLGP